MSQLNEGKKLFEAEKYSEAITTLTTFLKEKPNHADALFFRAISYRRVGEFQNSVNDFNAVIERLPEEATFYSERGVSYYHLKDYKTAMLDMDKAVELEPKNSYRYSSRAYIRAYFDVDGAIEDYEQATILDPKDEIAYNNLGLLLEKRGKMKAAQEKFKKSNDIIGYDPKKRELDSSDDEIKVEETKEVPESIEKTETAEASNLGKVMLDVFRNKQTRKEYLSYLKGIFKK